MAKQLSNLTNNARQLYNLIGDAGEVIIFELFFLPTQNGWGFNVTYNDFVFEGGYLILSPNILRGYRNLIPFGIMVNSIDGYEPQFINDFIDGRISLYLLNSTEVEAVESGIYA